MFRKILMAVIFFIEVSAFSNVLKKDDFVINFNGGFNLIVGQYNDYLSSSPVFGVSILYKIPINQNFINKYILSESEIIYKHMNFTYSEESYLSNHSLRSGVLFTYPFYSLFQPYIGVSVQGGTWNIFAKRLDERQDSIKIGVVAKGGFFSSFDNGIGLRMLLDYEKVYFTNSSFESINFLAGVTFNYFKYKRNSIKNKFDPEILFLKGKEFYNRKKIYKSRNLFLKFIKYKPKSTKALKYLSEIDESDKLLKKALNLSVRKKYYSAIPLLETNSKFNYLAELNLKKIRKLLKRRIPSNMNIGEIAYSKRKYRKCVFYMKRILLVDPNNKKAIMYLKRSNKRLRAQNFFERK